MAGNSFNVIENQFKVKLRQQRRYSFSNTNDTSGRPSSEAKSGLIRRRIRRRNLSTAWVVFDVAPDITESRSVEYKTMQPIHMPGQIYVYAGTTSRVFSLSNVKLISRTVEEATVNMQRLWTLRGWMMPWFGNGSSTIQKKRALEGSGNKLNNNAEPAAANDVGTELLGKPPEVLLLSAYSNLTASQRDTNERTQKPTNINNIPVVIQSMSIPYQSDVDYVPTVDGQPFPRVMILDIQLAETRAPREFSEQFSLEAYKSGTLMGW